MWHKPHDMFAQRHSKHDEKSQIGHVYTSSLWDVRHRASQRRAVAEPRRNASCSCPTHSTQRAPSFTGTNFKQQTHAPIGLVTHASTRARSIALMPPVTHVRSTLRRKTHSHIRMTRPRTSRSRRSCSHRLAMASRQIARASHHSPTHSHASEGSNATAIRCDARAAAR